jgi:ketosteroid isomerase-like protein
MRTMTLALGLALIFAAPAGAAPSEHGKNEKEVLARLDVWKEAMMKKDKAAFEKVLHPDLTYGHASGLIETRDQAIQHVVGSKASYTAINFNDTKVRVQGNTAMVTGKVDYQEHGATGKDTTINLVVLSVWVKGAPGWQMIARQATKPLPPAPPAAAAPTPPAAAH